MQQVLLTQLIIFNQDKNVTKINLENLELTQGIPLLISYKIDIFTEYLESYEISKLLTGKINILQANELNVISL